ncbi:hypothetical protein L1987_63966 [Smallanthus sonchifolius]|uniref:Uncharacterized protein n=1 Tax=Smallanthus sonchifolius TaxID=185202 RepID=A0ACB9CEN7_9ASTR|nr:hypothetical protein L1987_63966 [Smallanthus sonchifolius]
MERPRGLCRSAVREGKRRVSCCRNSGSSDRLRMVVNGGSMMLHNDGIKLRSNDVVTLMLVAEAVNGDMNLAVVVVIRV